MFIIKKKKKQQNTRDVYILVEKNEFLVYFGTHRQLKQTLNDYFFTPAIKTCQTK